MAVRIDAVFASTAGKGSLGSRELAAYAAKGCVRAANNGLHVPLILYAGVYRDDHVVEPAQAPYVQRALDELIGGKSEPRQDAFSFDVDNLLTAMEIAEGMIQSQGLGHALVVAVDGKVTHRMPCEVCTEASSGAILLRASDSNEGFVAFHSRVFTEHRELRQGRLQWSEETREHTMVVSESPYYLDACVDCANEAIRQLLADTDRCLDESTLIVPSQSPREFPQALHRRLGIDASRVVDAATARGPILTAGPIAALEMAVRDGRFEASDPVIFLTVHPGLTVSAAMYQKPRHSPAPKLINGVSS